MDFLNKHSKSAIKIGKINLSKICRCCLSDKATLKDVVNTKLPSMLQFCASIDLLEHDDLPKQICVTCLRLVTKFYVFKKKVQRCDALLQEFIHRTDRKGRRDKSDFSDILDKAINEADISVTKNIFLDEEDQAEEEKEVDAEEKVSVININLLEPPPLVPLENAIKNFKDHQEEEEDEEDEDEVDEGVIPPPLIPLKKANESKLEPPESLICNICNKQFNERKKLISHLRGHVVTKSYICRFCKKCYPNNSTLQVHIRRHTGERPFKCEHCNKGFVRSAGLREHYKTHTQLKPYICDICNRAFSVKSNLTRHRVLHSEALPFTCDYCDKKFSQSDNLQLHVRANHTLERPYLCSECGSRFVSAARLKRHAWMHSGYKRYRCKHCPKAYNNSIDLRIHSRLHKSGNGPEKPFSCFKCEKGFYHQCRLSKHMKVHEKPYGCDDCGRSFFKEDTLRKHRSSKHESAGDVDKMEDCRGLVGKN